MLAPNPQSTTTKYTTLNQRQRVILWDAIEPYMTSEGWIQVAKPADVEGVLNGRSLAPWLSARLGFAVKPSNIRSVRAAHGMEFNDKPTPRLKTARPRSTMKQDVRDMMDYLTRIDPDWRTVARQ